MIAHSYAAKCSQAVLTSDLQRASCASAAKVLPLASFTSQTGVRPNKRPLFPGELRHAFVADRERRAARRLSLRQHQPPRLGATASGIAGERARLLRESAGGMTTYSSRPQPPGVRLAKAARTPPEALRPRAPLAARDRSGHPRRLIADPVPSGQQPIVHLAHQLGLQHRDRCRALEQPQQRRAASATSASVGVNPHGRVVGHNAGHRFARLRAVSLWIMPGWTFSPRDLPNHCAAASLHVRSLPSISHATASNLSYASIP